ncbi:unnamed protein product [Symbiodinium natans]|uniref:Uncharacterized protein n=1 Tax=Symbiodinium natans TaxID=878477 RepID=A0A812IJ97_9DINO|nr:unnamed protein product [Symbiodinium natans]CAE7496271.1 unnamed protein product [Symbiodinium natans]
MKQTERIFFISPKLQWRRLTQVKDRTLGEGRTNSEVISNVPVQPIQGLTFVSPETKKAIIPSTHDTGGTKPESKRLGRRLEKIRKKLGMQGVSARAVLDLCPGDGGLALEAARKGAVYAAIAKNDAHREWLVRERLAMTKEGGALTDEGFAKEWQEVIGDDAEPDEAEEGAEAESGAENDSSGAES